MTETYETTPLFMKHCHINYIIDKYRLFFLKKRIYNIYNDLIIITKIRIK